jgi:hypothetical protein
MKQNQPIQRSANSPAYYLGRSATTWRNAIRRGRYETTRTSPTSRSFSGSSPNP